MKMKMTTNEALGRYNFITKILMKSESGELSKKMKVKVMSMRIELGKIKKTFDADIKEFADSIISEEFKALQQKQDKTEEEQAQLKEQADKINEEYAEYVTHRGSEEVTLVNDIKFTEDEYNEILILNVGNDVEINGQKLDSGDFLEVLHDLFVEE